MQPFNLLRIDLSSGTWETERVERHAMQSYLGGAGLAAYLLQPHLRPDVDALDPKAPLLFLSGPLTGTTGPAVGRFVICARSPATGLWGESNVGGHFGPAMRAAGYDGIWISGRAPKPVYLWIDHGEIEIRSAEAMWGRLDTYETQAEIQRALGDPTIRVASIGEAGERQIPFALVLCDHGRVAGRTGMGAVMGSKNLKAIAVRGHKAIEVADVESFQIHRRAANRALAKDSVTQALRSLGTGSASDYFDYLGEMPKRYFTRGEFERASEVSGASMSETILSGVSTCHGCVIACGRVVKLEDQEPRKGPEYETIVGFGPNLEISDLSWITQMGELCDRYGMDSISLSNVLGLIFLLFERGRIPPEMLGSRRFEWGDMRAAEELVHLTARREGLGALLAQGARSVAAHFDAPELAVEVNGLEVAYHDPRGATGMALVYATSPRGACHNQSDYFMVEIGQTMDELGIDYFPRTAGPQKSANVARHQDWRTVCNSLVLCIFSNVSPEAVLELLKHGMDFQGDLEDLMLAGERAWNLKRLINLQLGLPAGADRLPALMLHPYSDGGSAGVEVPFEEMLQAYYQARGWDPDTGRPELETLRRLGLDHLHI